MCDVLLLDVFLRRESDLNREDCPYIRGVLVEGFHCITMVGEIVAC